MSETVRTVAKFEWICVPEPLTRALLVAAYNSKGQTDDVRRLKGLSALALATQAEQSLGRPPAIAYRETLTPTLLERWVPSAPLPALR